MKKILLSLALACMGLTVSTNAQILTQDFESTAIGSVPAGYTNVHTGGGNGWQVNSGAVNWSLGTLPAHTKYCYVNEYPAPYNTPATLTTTSFNLAGTTSPYLSYDWFYFKAYLSASPYTPEQAWVEISDDGGTTWTLLDSINYSPSGAWSTYFQSLAGHSSTNTMLRFQYTDNGAHIIGVAIDNISVFNATANDIALTSVAPAATAVTDYFVTGSNATFTGTVLNHGLSAISTFNINYQLAGGGVVTSPITASIPSFTSYSWTAPTPAAVPAGTTVVKVWTTLTGDTNPLNDSMTTAVVGVASFPTKTPLFEEATGSWCGFCVRGIIFMDSLFKMYGSSANGVSIVSVHDYNTYDPMSQENSSTKAYDALQQTMVGGYPSMVIDRRGTDDPQNCLTDYTPESQIFGFADMTVSSVPAGATSLSPVVTVKPALNLSGDYRVEIVLTENFVTGTASGYAQHNYYGIGGSANSTTMTGCGYNFNDSSTVIPAGHIKFPFVDRLTNPIDISPAGSPNGVAGSLPATMTAGTTYTYTSTPMPIASDWNINNIRIVAMLIDNNPNNLTYGTVLNSANSGLLISALGGNTVKSVAEGMTVFPNPAKDEAHVQFNLTAAGNVGFNVYDVAGRSVFSVPSVMMTEGGQQINFSTAAYAAGIYKVVVTTEDGTYTQSLSVVK